MTEGLAQQPLKQWTYEYLRWREAEQEAKRWKDEAGERIRAYMHELELASIEVDTDAVYAIVTLAQRQRESVDMRALALLVEPEIRARVTRVTEYEELRVTEKAREKSNGD